MSKACFTISYQGSALEDHAMDVRDLAPALLSLGQLIERSNFLLNQNQTTVRLEVRALKAGSFEVDLALVQSLYEQAARLLTGDFVTSALNLAELIFGSAGLWSLYKFLKGRRPDRAERLDGGYVKLIIGDESHTFPLRLLRLYEDMALRKAVEEVVRPLENEGIERFVVRDDRYAELASTTREERVWFANQPEKVEDRLLSDRNYEGIFAIIAPVFKDDNKWRLSDGAATLNVSIFDQEFLQRVDARRESFYKGDLLRCEIRTRQWETDAGLRTEHEVLRVIEHIQSGRQLRLFPFQVSKAD
jgi:hypothetical protein